LIFARRGIVDGENREIPLDGVFKRQRLRRRNMGRQERMKKLGEQQRRRSCGRKSIAA
jgi:hypothetical protein